MRELPGQWAGQNLACALLALLGHPASPGDATMATEALLRLRLDALKAGSCPAVRVPPGRLLISAVLVATLLATAAWLPRYPKSHAVRSMPTLAMRALPGKAFGP